MGTAGTRLPCFPKDGIHDRFITKIQGMCDMLKVYTPPAGRGQVRLCDSEPTSLQGVHAETTRNGQIGTFTTFPSPIPGASLKSYMTIQMDLSQQ